MNRFRLWLAGLISPEMARQAARYRCLHYEISHDRWWLAADFPEVKAFSDRLLARDENLWRSLDDPERPSPWNWDISVFREQLRRGDAR